MLMVVSLRGRPVALSVTAFSLRRRNSRSTLAGSSEAEPTIHPAGAACFQRKTGS